MPQRGVKLVGEAIPGVTGSSPERAAALNHELRDHAVEGQPVVKRPLHLLSRARVFEFLCSFRETDEIRDRLRGLLFEQAADNRPLRSVEYGVGAWCAAQGFLLRKAKCGGIITHSARRGQQRVFL